MKSVLGKLAGVAALSAVLHVALGWAWTLGAGVAAGLWHPRAGARLGALGVGLGWALLLAASAFAAPEPTARLVGIVGGLAGNLPAWAVVAMGPLAGALLGAVGGALGRSLRRALRPTTSTRQTVRT